MSRTTKEINKVTGTIIGVSGKLIIYALVILLLYEGISKGYEFGYEIFHSTPMAAAPGSDVVVEIDKGDTLMNIADKLIQKDLIRNEYAFVVQSKMYAYGKPGKFDIKPGTYILNNSMTSKEMILALRDGPKEEEDKQQ